ncbi:MAG: zf-HC2 domain-containing protein [Actinomycetota bacterium]|nr:zf-HC2 domain-containing protein [Actinomycetota bacterium]
MCYDEGTLQAYIDRELPGRRRWEIEAHVETCEACKAGLALLRDASEAAQVRLTPLSKQLHSKTVSTEAAWMRLTNDERIKAPPRRRGVFEMLQGRLKTALVPLAAVAVLAMALSFAPVRGLAADFLNIFRVQNVEVITISPEDMHALQRLGEEGGGKVDIENLGKIESGGFTQPEQVTMNAAKEAVDFDLKLPQGLTGYNEPSYNVQKGFATSFTLDVDKANEVFKSFGATQLLPGALDGKKFTAKMPTVVIVNYPKENGGMVVIGQARSPEFILPAGVDADAVRDVLLSLPALPENIRKQLEAVKDWRNTLIIPNIDGSAKEVKVGDAEGVFITPPREHAEGDSALVWQRDGVIYGISGQLDLAAAQEIAASLK